MLNWTETELAATLKRNPAIRINEKYSTPPRSARGKSPRAPRVALAPMEFYDEEMPVKLLLPFTYPSLNRLLRMNRWERKKEEDSFRDAVRWAIKLDGIKAYRSPVDILVVVYSPVLRHRDRDNYCLKWLKDALKGFVIVDDDPRYVASERVEFAKGKKRTEVFISPKGVRP